MANVEVDNGDTVEFELDGVDGGVVALENIPEIAGIDLRVDPEVLANVAMVVRRPPELQFGPGLTNNTPHIEQLVLNGLDAVTSRTTGQLAYALAELLVRREPQIAASEDQSGAAGLWDIGDIVRMFEHLSVLQTGN